MPRRRCCIPNCSSKEGGEKKISFHEIPVDVNRRPLWLKAISRQRSTEDSPWIPSEYSLVCQKHFKEDDYCQYSNQYLIVNQIRRLKPTAVPSIFLPKSITVKTKTIKMKSKASVKKSDQEQNRNMDYISCAVPGCQSKSHRKIKSNVAEENILLFPVPRADRLYNKWKATLLESNIELTTDDHICERHFVEHDIERYHRTKTSDGNIIERKKRRPTLKRDAVPIKFLKPSYSIKRKLSRKHLVSQNSVGNLNDEISSAVNSSDTGSVIDIKDDVSEELPVSSVNGQTSLKNCLPYNELLKNIQLVKNPNKYWSVACTDAFTIFARWNKKFIAEKRLVIESSSTIRVFLQDLEIEMTDLVDLTTVDDVTSLLKKVESYNMDSFC